MNKFEEWSCEELRVGEAERFFPRRVQVLEIAVKPGDTQHINRERKKLVALFLRPLAFGDIHQQTSPEDVTVGLSLRAGSPLEPLEGSRLDEHSPLPFPRREGPGRDRY